MSEIIPKGMWFEELEVGLVVKHPLTRTVTESDNVQFTVATMNPAPLHLDAAYASTTQFGQVIVNSMFTVALVVGISVHDLTHGTTVANLGFEEVTFPAPVFHGDTIRVESEVLEARESKSSADRGIVKIVHRGYNQNDVLVCAAVRNAMMHKRPAA
ncbi:MAG: MaoC family dehydratase [Actinomycetota bacterium]